MPYTLSMVGDGILCNYTNNATQNDIAEAIGKVGTELDGRDVRFVIHDFSAADSLDSGSAAQLFFTLKSRGKQSVGTLQMVAVVTRDEVFSYLVEEFKKHTSYQTKVFRTLMDAQAWIGLALQ